MGNTLVLFTAAFPFRSYTEEVFLMPELEALEREFSRIIVVPLERRAESIRLPFGNAETDTFIADHVFTKFKLLKSPYLLHPAVISRYPHLVKESKSPKGFLTGAFFCMNARCFGDIIARWIDKKGLDLNRTLFYTFWFDHITSALAMVSERMNLKIVTRAHGHDVYDSQIGFRSHRFRAYTMSRIDKIFPASDNATKYLIEQYPSFSDKISTRILGSTKIFPDKTSSAHSSDSGKWTFFSCARLSKEKRVDRCLDLVRTIASAYPFKQIKWIHVGDGPLMAELKKSIERVELPVNLTIDLRGPLTNEEVQRIYVDEPIDWSMLLSDSEGGCPIALCEALSYGVPVVATDVGGIPEIITPDVGITVHPDTAPESIVGEMQPYLNYPMFYDELKSESLKRWEEHFRAETLRCGFANELSLLIRQRP